MACNYRSKRNRPIFSFIPTALFTALFTAFWGIFVGIVFSTVGAAGGLLPSFAFISFFDVQNPNDVKLMSQIIVLAVALTFVPGYLQRNALVWPLGVLLGIGGLFGAYAGSTISGKYLNDMGAFIPLFGVFTLLIALQIIWKLYQKRNAVSEDTAQTSVQNMLFVGRDLQFFYGLKKYKITAYSPIMAGFSIAFIASIFGVGGGFLLVPYMVSILRLPMHIIPGTAAIAIIMSTVVSMGNYVSLGAKPETSLLIPMLIGALLGAYLGPKINKRAKNSWLQAALVVILMMIAIKYIIF